MVSRKTRRVSKVNRGGSYTDPQKVRFEGILVSQIGINLFALARKTIFVSILGVLAWTSEKRGDN